MRRRVGAQCCAVQKHVAILERAVLAPEGWRSWYASVGVGGELFDDAAVGLRGPAWHQHDLCRAGVVVLVDLALEEWLGFAHGADGSAANLGFRELPATTMQLANSCSALVTVNERPVPPSMSRHSKACSRQIVRVRLAVI